jgi:enoyl-CoA hydratase
MVSYAEYEHLDVKVANRVAVLTLSRPEVRNAMNRAMIRELHRIWRDLADDLSVNPVVLTGAGRQFSVGCDVKQMSTRAGGDSWAKGEQWDPAISRRPVTQLLELDKPIICAINGDCVGLAATRLSAHRRKRQGQAGQPRDRLSLHRETEPGVDRDPRAHRARTAMLPVQL